MTSSCLIIAGEKSGEEHALTFFSNLRQLRPDLHFYGVGGDDLSAQGMELLYHLKDFSSMGFSEVIAKIPFYFKAMKRITAEVEARHTKYAILIDFQDFNFRLARSLHKRGVKVFYYVAPQAWAWKEWRAYELGKNINTLYSILFFEKEWFKQRGVKQIVNIPHPLWSRYAKEIKDIDFKRSFGQKINLLLLPGSRNSEVSRLLPIYAQTVALLRTEFDLNVSLVRTSSVDDKYYQLYGDQVDHFYQSEELPEALKNADMAMAASGTVTLACALFGLPTLVCYRASLLNVFIFRQFIRYNGPASLANILHGHYVFPEFWQDECNPQILAYHFKKWLNNKEEYLRLKNELKNTEQLVRGECESVASDMAPKMVEHLS